MLWQKNQAIPRVPLCPFCVQRYLTRLDFPSFFNVLEEPFVRASLLLSYCRSCILFHVAANLVTELLISRFKVRFLPRSPSFQSLGGLERSSSHRLCPICAAIALVDWQRGQFRRCPGADTSWWLLPRRGPSPSSPQTGSSWPGTFLFRTRDEHNTAPSHPAGWQPSGHLGIAWPPL